jgi:hypothetical protein
MARNELAVTNNNLSIFESAEKWELATKMAASLAKSTIVPKEFQNNANNALIAIEMASRLRTSPLMVMQHLYVVYGRPSWSAQYVIAMINGSGKYDMELQFEEKADDKGRPHSCMCWTEKNGRKVTGPVVTMDLAKAEGWYDKNGSKWKTMPQMMLRYRAASFFGRMNCPDLMMGMYTREEVEEFGREEYLENMQTEVEAEIAGNANSVQFEAIEEKPEPPTVPKAQTKEKELVKVEGEQDLPDFMKAEG